MIPAPAAERRNDIDWLRIGATWLLFVFHTGKIFDVEPFYHLKNDELSHGMGYLTGFIHQWHMRLFFLLAGWSLCASLAVRGRKAFVAERNRRLLVPFLAGCLLFGPFLRYAEVVSGTYLAHDGTVDASAHAGEGFLEFLPSFFTFSGFSWAHLWFLIYLYVFTRLYLPIFDRSLRRGRTWHEVHPAWAWLPILPLALVQVTLRDRWPGVQNLYDDWANFAFYSGFFAAGFLMKRQPAFERAALEQSRGLLGVGLLACAGLALPWSAVLARPEIATRALSGAAAWGCVVGLLGIAQRHWRADLPALPYLREASLPVYILHSPAIVAVGLLVLPLPLGIPAKFALILAGSVALTLALHHLAVRRLAPLRVLFGLRPRRPRLPALPAAQAS